MINEKEQVSDVKNSPNQFDARIVQTVRNLKKLPSRQSDENKSRDFSKENISTTSDNSKKMNSSREYIAKSLNKKIEVNKDNLFGRISIDVSEQSTSESAKFNLNNNTKYSKNNSSKTVDKKPKVLKPISNQNLKVSADFTPYKTKSEFQKRLMSENNLVKYKSMCVTLLKDDEEIKKLCEICLIINMSSTGMYSSQTQQLDNFIENNLFSDKYFLYKLETLLNSDVSKQTKEKFFREEIKKIFELQILDIQFENKMKKLNNAIDSHINNIQTFEFFK
jgi:hypothetical protein